MRFLARAGLVARGVMYVLIGWIAVQIAVGHSRQQADRTGALHAVAGPDHVRCLLVLRGKVAQALARPRPAVAMRRPRFCPAIPAGWNRIS
jgi:hypothetical protein